MCNAEVRISLNGSKKSAQSVAKRFEKSLVVVGTDEVWEVKKRDFTGFHSPQGIRQSDSKLTII